MPLMLYSSIGWLYRVLFNVNIIICAGRLVVGETGSFLEEWKELDGVKKLLKKVINILDTVQI